jgi:hypothetical protein
MGEIKSKVVALRLVKWRSLDWLQTENLKEISPEDLEKIKNSLVNNNFVQPFTIWKDKSGKEWILDGRTRKIAMSELEKDGIKIPDKLPANFIECKNKKEAAKLVLVFSSSYAKMTEHGLKEFLDLNNLMYKDIQNEIDLPGLDLSLLIPEEPEFTDEKNLSMIETAKNMSDVYIVIGEYRILLKRDTYLNWIEALKDAVGYDKISVMEEIKKRLKIK